MKYIKSPMNYTGGKYKLLDSIIPIVGRPKHFVDLFAGGLNVGVNVDADIIYANEKVSRIVDIYKCFQKLDTEDIISQIKNRINEFSLSITNAHGYNTLRDAYNSNPNPIDLFVLICFSFNHQIRFNSKNEFNISFGKERSAYNNRIELNLIQFCNALHSKKFIFSDNDFRDFDFSQLSSGDVVYCDPPYLISNAAYNDNQKFCNWTENDDKDLFDILDMLNDKGICFIMSNVIQHKGNINYVLKDYAKKYNTVFLDKTYSNCSYHLKDRDSQTLEVLITNY